MVKKWMICVVLMATALSASCTAREVKQSGSESKMKAEKSYARVKLGNEVILEKHLDWLKDKRVGLITNPTGVNSTLESTVDVFQQHPDINLVALYGPEHGVRGNFGAGEKIDNMVDEKTGIPMYSLYGKTHKPTPEMLENVDVLVFDIQDIGSRSYTYIWTMARGMEAAAENDKEFIVLDRPNPIGGVNVEGNVLDPKFKSGIGYLPIPYVHGMTIGELALMFNDHFKINCDLKVAKLRGWKRDMTYKDTGLMWIRTSPHIPEADTSYFYNITGIYGELNGVNIGVGYTAPFKFTAAPFIDAEELADHLNAQNIYGVRFSPAYYSPYYFHFKGEQCQGVRIHLLDPPNVKTCAVGFHIMTAMRGLYPEDFNFEVEANKRRIGMFDKACGTDQVRKDFIAGKSAEEIVKNWEANLGPFLKIREKYLIY